MASEVCIVMVQLSSAYSVQAARSSAAALQPVRQAASGNTATIAETVSISTAARTAQSSQRLPTTDEAYPVEYYAIPDWQADLMPVELSGKLGARADELYVKGGNLLGTHPSEVAEYSALLDTHLQALLQKEGIETLPQYHQALVVDKDNSDRIRLLLKDSIAGDKRLTELMGTLGIQFPD